MSSGTVTITVGRDVHQRLVELRTRENESFSEVLRRTLPQHRPTWEETVEAIRKGEWNLGLTPEGIAFIRSFEEPFEQGPE